MWNIARTLGESSVAVAIDKDKGSQHALKWAVDHILTRGQTVTLIHVNQTTSSVPSQRNNSMSGISGQHMDLFLPFRCFCSRREVLWEIVTLEDQDIAKALIEYVSYNRVDTLLLGAPSRSGLSRLLFKNDVPGAVLKGAPYFCNVYVIAKGKIASARAASSSLPLISAADPRTQPAHRNFNNDIDFMGRSTENRSHDEVSVHDTDISFVSSGRVSTDSAFFDFYDNLGSQVPQRPPKCMSVGRNFDPLHSNSKSPDFNAPDQFSAIQQGSQTPSWKPKNIEEVDEKMRRLELEMKQTMDMYHTACKEALTAKQKARELQLLKMEDEKRLGEAIRTKEEALVIAEKEKEKAKTAIEVAKAAYRKADQEAQKRINAELKALKEAEDNKKFMIDSLGHSHLVLKYQSLLHIMVVLFIFYFYFFELR